VASPADRAFPYTSWIGGFAKPARQTGTGVPADQVHELSAVSLCAAKGGNYSFYPRCIPVIDYNPARAISVLWPGGWFERRDQSFNSA
jgi:hypothetical protein